MMHSPAQLRSHLSADGRRRDFLTDEGKSGFTTGGGDFPADRCESSADRCKGDFSTDGHSFSTDGRRRGFALVVALMLMGFILVLVISLSTLTRVEVYASDQKAGQMQARSNALLGLQVALGELQRYLGPDQAVSATASLLDGDLGVGSGPDEINGVEHPAWVGVWTSDKVPAPSSLRTSRVDNIVDAAQAWLVSGVTIGGEHSPLAELDGETVTLAAERTALFDPLVKHPAVLVPKVQIGGGSYAYWVSDEGVKVSLGGASLRQGSENALLSQLSQRALGMTLVGSGSLEGNTFKDFVSERENNAYEKIYSLEEAAFIPATARGDGFDSVIKNGLHDLTVNSIGLLTNTRTGGLRKDLSTLLASGVTAPVGRIFPQQSSEAAQGGPQWKQLQDFLNLAAAGSPYINESGELVPFVPASGVGTDNLSIAPVVVRIQYFHTGKIIAKGTGYALRLYYMPALVLWNPYSLPIAPQDYLVHLVNVNGGNPGLTLEYQLNITAGDGSAIQIGDMEHANSVTVDHVDFVQEAGYSGPMLLRLRGAGTGGNRPVGFEPGEIKVFSMEESTDRSSDFYLTEGWYPAEGFYHDVDLPGVDSNADFGGATLRLRHGSTYAYDVRLRNSDGRDLGWISVVQRGTVGRTGSSRKEFMPASPAFPNPGDGYPAALGTYAELALPNPPDAGSATTQARRRPWLALYNPLAFRFFRDANFANSGNNQYSPLYISRVEKDLGLGEGGEYNLDEYRIQGSDKLVLIQIPDPELPPYSLGQLQHAPLRQPSNTAGGSHADSFVPLYAIGNSLSNPNIGLNAVYAAPAGYVYYDTSWLLNNALWDEYFLSSINYAGANTLPATHPRLLRLDPQTELIPMQGELRAAANHGILGAFNVNSTSVQAWKALLGSFIGVAVDTEDAGTDTGSARAPLLRLNKPLRGEHAFDGLESGASAAQGFRALSEAQIESLAVEIVRQVKDRGPFLDLASFVNRSTHSAAADSHKRSGAIQAALDAPNHSSRTLNHGFSTRQTVSGYADNESMNIPLSWGMAGFLTQGDVLSRIGHLLSPRSDTFKIRVYGESSDMAGNIIGKAYGEAIVQRLPQYVNPADNNAWEIPAAGSENDRFGRRFVVVSFRWLSEDEI